tara:strand:+ start:1049 stop:5038 length:3990 start_codon:yes stop_codon:yes gene_type:complete
MFLHTRIEDYETDIKNLPYSITKYDLPAQFVESVSSGFRNNLLGQSIEATRRAAAQHYDERDPISEEDFKVATKGLEELGLQWDPTEKPLATSYRINAALRDSITQEVVDQDAGLISLQGLGFIGGSLLDPVSLFPPVKALSAAKAVHAARAGKAVSAGFHTMKNFVAASAATNVLFEAPYAGLMKFNNRQEYTALDSLVNIPLSTAFETATFGLLSTAGAVRQAHKVNKTTTVNKQISKMLDEGDYEGALNYAYSNDPVARKMAGRFKQLRKFIDDPNKPLTDEAVTEALDFIRIYNATSKRMELDKIISNRFLTQLKSGDKTLRDLRNENSSLYKRLDDAFKTGNVNKLTEDDINILNEAGIEVRKVGDEKVGDGPEIVEKVGFQSDEDSRVVSTDPEVRKELGEKLGQMELDFNPTQTPETGPRKVRTSESFNNRAKALDQVRSDPEKFFSDTVQEMLGDEQAAALLLSVPKKGKALTHFKELKQKLNDLGYDDDSFVVRLIPSLAKLSKDTALVITEANKIIKGELDPTKIKNLDFEDLTRVMFIKNDPDLSPGQKRALIIKHFNVQRNAKISRLMLDGIAVENAVNKVAAGTKGGTLNEAIALSTKNRIQLLQNHLDGVVTRGVNSSSSVDMALRSKVQEDLVPILEVLEDFGLRNLFLAENTLNWALTFKNKDLANSYRLYGENLSQASDKFNRDLIEAMQGRMPEAWKGVEGFEELIRVIKQVQRNQLTDFNKIGVPILENRGFFGLSQTYSREVVTRMSKEDFVQKMLSYMDVDQTRRLHGNIMNTSKGVKEFNAQKLLASMYDQIVRGEFDEVTGNVNSGAAKSRKIAFKKGSEVDAILEFSGFDNIGKLMIDQIRNRSEQIAVARHMGSDPKATFSAIKNRLNIDETSARSGRASLQYKVLNATHEYLSGNLDNPVDANLSLIGKKIRQLSNLVFLPGSGLSTLTDVPMIASQMRLLGADYDSHIKEMIHSYQESTKRRFGDNRDETSKWLSAQAAGFDILLRTLASRVAIGESGSMDLTGKLNNLLFTVNGLTKLTTIHQDIFLNLATRHLAAELPKGTKASPQLLRELSDFGFTADEIKKLTKYIEKTQDGVKRLGPTSIGDDIGLSSKLRQFLLTHMRQAVMEPDAGSQAMSRGLFQAGTPMGETARIAFQYSSFPLAMGRLMLARFLTGYQGDHPFGVRRMAEFLSYTSSALAMSYFITVLKDLSRFEEPMNPLDLTGRDWLRLVNQSGIGGPTEYLINVANFGPQEVLSPLPGQLLEVSSDVVTLDAEGLGESLDPFTLSNYPLIGKPIQEMIGFGFGESFNDIITRELDVLSE